MVQNRANHLRERAGSAIRAMCILPLLGSSGLALQEPSGLCDIAAEEAARNTGVPLGILRAITRVETGRTTGGELLPWPWSVNEGGAGQWFSNAADAKDYVSAALESGVSNIDIGCFQLNHRWHAQRFASLDAMFDPVENAHQAALFLLDLQAETGDWSAAVAAYHSRTPEHADRYLARFESVLAHLDAPDLSASPTRENRYPLLMAGASRSAGSLVPMTGGGLRLIGQLP